MTPDQVRDLAGTVLRPVLGDENVQDIVVREDDDGSGEPSFSVDVFLSPGTLPVGAKTYVELRRALTSRLGHVGERRYAYLRLRDKAGEEDEDVTVTGPNA